MPEKIDWEKNNTFPGGRINIEIVLGNFMSDECEISPTFWEEIARDKDCNIIFDQIEGGLVLFWKKEGHEQHSGNELKKFVWDIIHLTLKN